MYRLLILMLGVAGTQILFFACNPCGKGNTVTQKQQTLSEMAAICVDTSFQNPVVAGDTFSGDSICLFVQMKIKLALERSIDHNPYAAYACDPLIFTGNNPGITRMQFGVVYSPVNTLDTSIAESMRLMAGSNAWKWKQDAENFISSLNQNVVPLQFKIKAVSPKNNRNMRFVVQCFKSNGDTVTAESQMVYTR